MLSGEKQKVIDILFKWGEVIKNRGIVELFNRGTV